MNYVVASAFALEPSMIDRHVIDRIIYIFERAEISKGEKLKSTCSTCQKVDFTVGQDKHGRGNELLFVFAYIDMYIGNLAHVYKLELYFM